MTDKPQSKADQLRSLREQRSAKNTNPVAKGAVSILKRGRPKVTGPRPWEEARMSKRSWYRRQAEKRDAKE